LFSPKDETIERDVRNFESYVDSLVAFNELWKASPDSEIIELDFHLDPNDTMTTYLPTLIGIITPEDKRKASFFIAGNPLYVKPWKDLYYSKKDSLTKREPEFSSSIKKRIRIAENKFRAMLFLRLEDSLIRKKFDCFYKYDFDTYNKLNR